MPPAETRTLPRLFGRSSSHFTRVTRIFACELEVACEFRVVADLLSRDPGDYGGNPALTMPTLHTAEGSWFGALNVCRVLSRLSEKNLRLVWPEALSSPLLVNAQELTLHAMSTEVALILSKLAHREADTAHQTKMRESLSNALSWLDSNADEAILSLPSDRDLSYLEVSLFCLVTHLEFRELLPVAHYQNLTAFCQRFSERSCSRATPYHFDA
jgi:hypothetical protein